MARNLFRPLRFERLEKRELLSGTQFEADTIVPAEEGALVTTLPDSTLELTQRVSTSSDDAEEKSSGSVSLTSRDIELVDDDSRTGRTIGIRFQNIEIPPDASILSAEIQFTVDEKNTKSTAIEISGELSANAATFSSSKHNISSRTKTNVSISWTPPEWNTVWETGPDQTPPDLSSIVNEIIRDTGWASGNSMVFLFTGSGERTAEAYDGVASKAPLLRIVFETQTAPAPPPSPDPTPEPAPSPEPDTILSRSVSQSGDDAEEKASGKMKLASRDLELVEDSSNQTVGLRFQNITIPQGSSITDATIQFKVDEASSDAVSLNIFGELVANAQTFSSVRNNISTRPLTGSSVTWAPPAWNTVGEAGPAQKTLNLAPIIQEIVNQESWASGNALVVIISGSGKRVAESFDGTFAPEFSVAYGPAPTPADTFAGLNSASEIVVINGTNRTQKYEASAATDRAFDARNASFLISETTHGIITMEGDASQTGMYWAGGYVSGDKPWNASWDDWKYDPQTRNSTVINNKAYSATVSGMHFFNVHDGPRSNNAFDWTVQHVWGEYVRDDCIESDGLHSGKVVDSLFDGCYTGISTRPISSNTEADGRGEVVTLDRVLLRLEASPYPYKWETKSGMIDENGDPWDGTGIPYGHGSLFKYDKYDIDRNVHFVIKDSVFLLPHDNVPVEKLSFPPEELIDELSNVTVIWLGEGSYPGYLPTDKFPNGITVLTGQEGLDFWKEKVVDWHLRHPDVDAGRIPADPGSFVFPRIF